MEIMQAIASYAYGRLAGPPRLQCSRNRYKGY